MRELSEIEIGAVSGGLLIVPLAAIGKVVGAAAGGFALAGITYGVSSLLTDS